ncbi:MAG: nicotinamide-nucleotide amidohydrolase family protein [Frankiaceae bacterium]|nr:nicotinamide-nucleotide amidohydrolase family protein [Frankiaceae bacterium]MBV9871544.1 nicotinamide-nucleotide amidohydrolase family protein [Frankiaceae bacterium]
MSDLAADIHQRLLERGETVATAESLTAGLVGAELTRVAGSSATYRGGVIVYATELKAQLAGVPGDLLAARGPVDREVAAAMAVGIRERIDATWGLSLTGVAGPDPQDGKPVGLVFVGLAVAGRTPAVAELMLSGDRAAIRTGAVAAALALLRDTLAAAE